MANFNEKVNCGIGYNPNSKEFLIYRRGSIIPCFRIPAEVFENFFGLKENFSEQYEKVFVVFEHFFDPKENFSEQCENVFVKTEDANPVQEENDLIEEAKRNIESCMNLLDTNECQLERTMDAIKAALMDIEDQKCELGVMLSKLDNTLRKLNQGFELSGISE